jgi:hypothetical protein
LARKGLARASMRGHLAKLAVALSAHSRAEKLVDAMRSVRSPKVIEAGARRPLRDTVPGRCGKRPCF